ncbi:MAG: hypothetical protein HC836_19200 [Richelia sp. RM2_1_2]|nr:hypothetical protein [Richelia sp. RM2_1_2]
MNNTAVIDKVNSLNKGSGYSNNRMAYELSKILKEPTVDKITPQQEASARKEFTQVFSSRDNPRKNKEELANQFRDRFLKQMGIAPYKVKPQIYSSPSKVEPDKDKNKIELPKLEEIRKAIPQIIRTIIFKGKVKDTNHKSFDTPKYNASLELDGDNQKLTLERKNDKLLALEAIKKGRGEFEIINNFIAKEELEQIQKYIKLQPQNNQNIRIKTKNKNSDLEI